MITLEYSINNALQYNKMITLEYSINNALQYNTIKWLH